MRNCGIAVDICSFCLLLLSWLSTYGYFVFVFWLTESNHEKISSEFMKFFSLKCEIWDETTKLQCDFGLDSSFFYFCVIENYEKSAEKRTFSKDRKRLGTMIILCWLRRCVLVVVVVVLVVVFCTSSSLLLIITALKLHCTGRSSCFLLVSSFLLAGRCWLLLVVGRRCL
jgi:hypothetical protein